jgi:LmbE family N-acetylglucosaminyl deacetylase
LAGSESAQKSRIRAAVLVAHPDDEVLWAGGVILSHPEWDWFIATLCRASDPDRSPRFFRVMERLGAMGKMADLDDGPDQVPLAAGLAAEILQALLPSHEYEIVFTHGPKGEYTRHRRHEETCRAVADLWKAEVFKAKELRLFAYADRGRGTLPTARMDADLQADLDEETWREKYTLITQAYGFDPSSWEARVTPRKEAFWRICGVEDLARIGAGEEPTI